MSGTAAKLRSARPVDLSRSTCDDVAQRESEVSVRSKLSKWLRPSLIVTVATAFTTFALTAIQAIALARTLEPEGRGEYGTAVFFTQMLTYVGLCGVQFAVARRAASDAVGRAELSRSAIRLGSLTGCCTLLAVATIAFVFLPPDKRQLLPLSIVCALALPIEHVRLLLLAVDQGSGAFRRYNSVQVATSAVFPLLLLVFWGMGKVSVTVAVLLTLMGPLIGLAIRMAISPTVPRVAGPAAPRGSTLLREGYPYLYSMTVSDLFGRFDALLFLWLASFSGQGLYFAAVPAASLLLVAPNALSIFSFNAGARRDSTISTSHLLGSGVLVLLFQMVTAGLFALVVGRLISLVYGSKFSGAIPLALALLPAYAIYGFSQVAEGYLRGRGKLNVGVYARIVAAGAMLLTVWFSFSRLGDLAIPIAASVAHGIVAIILTWFILRMPHDESLAAPAIHGEEACA